VDTEAIPRVGWRGINTPSPYVGYLAKFGRSKSNTVGVSRGFQKKMGALGLSIGLGRVAGTLETAFPLDRSSCRI